MSDSLCKICQTVLKDFRPTVEDRIYRECPECQWISLSEASFLSLDDQKERYLQHENSDQNAGYVKMLDDFIDSCVEPFTKPGSRILDYGCGSEPVLANLLRQRGYAVSTYDFFFEPDKTALHAQYDLMVLTEVLEHLSNPLEVLERLVRQLNPRGVVSIMTLFHPNDRDGFSKWWYRRDKTHVTFYTVRTIEVLAKRLGLDLLYSDGRRTATIGKVNLRL